MLDPATGDSLEECAQRFPDSASCQQNRAKGGHFSREPKLSDFPLSRVLVPLASGGSEPNSASILASLGDKVRWNSPRLSDTPQSFSQETTVLPAGFNVFIGEGEDSAPFYDLDEKSLARSGARPADNAPS